MVTGLRKSEKLFLNTTRTLKVRQIIVRLAFQAVVAKTTPICSSLGRPARTHVESVNPFISVVQDLPKTTKVTSPCRRRRLRRRCYHRFRLRLLSRHPILDEKLVQLRVREASSAYMARLPLQPVGVC